MGPGTVAKGLALGRFAIGAAMVAKPGAVALPWLGSAGAAATVPTRALGAREVLLGFLAAHVADRPGVGARTVQAIAVMDVVDLLATLAARRDVPKLGLVGVVGMAGGSAAAGFWAGSQLPKT